MSKKTRKQRKAKYYVKESWWQGWTGVMQVANNVIVAICPEESIAQTICDFLNELPRGAIHYQYAHKRRKQTKESEDKQDE